MPDNDADFNRALGAWERNQELQMGDEGDDSKVRDPMYCPKCTRRSCVGCPV